MHQMISSNEIFIKYVACEKCYTVYEQSECIEINGTVKRPKRCTHRNLNHGRTCQTALLKCVELKNEQQILHPIKVYGYALLIKYMNTLLNRQDKCDHWRHYNKRGDLYNDVYDGRIWNEFKGKPFLTEPFSYALMLNTDWFKPCKHVEYSIGAIYLTVMNLPREMRLRRENVLLIGLIAGPHEPKHDVNSQLQPLIHELLQLWKRVRISVSSYKQPVYVWHVTFLHHVRCVATLLHWVVQSVSGSLGNRNYLGFEVGVTNK